MRGDLVRAVHAIQARDLRGVMNVGNPMRRLRADVALALAETMQADPSLVEVISLYDIPAMAGRPLDTSMACGRLCKDSPLAFTPIAECMTVVAANWASA